MLYFIDDEVVSKTKHGQIDRGEILTVLNVKIKRGVPHLTFDGIDWYPEYLFENPATDYAKSLISLRARSLATSTEEEIYVDVDSDLPDNIDDLYLERDKLDKFLKQKVSEKDTMSSQVTKLNNDLFVVKQILEKIRNRDRLVAAKIKDLKQEEKVISNSNFFVSDHAVLRYLERAKGMDIEALRREILPPETQRKLAVVGNATFGKLVVRDGVVVTYLGDKK